MSLITEYHNSITVITLDRPKKAHAYHRAMLLDLQEQFSNLSKKSSVIIIQSRNSRAFCGGADLDEMKSVDPLSALDMLSQKVFTQIATSSSITIAAIHGAAVAGGCELALACDLRVAGPKASFSLPETQLGLIPSAGGCTRLIKLIGETRSKGMILGGDIIDAQEALAWGLVNRIADDPQQEAMSWAKQIAQRNHLALRLAKNVLANPSLEMERLTEALLYMQKGNQS